MTKTLAFFDRLLVFVVGLLLLLAGLVPAALRWDIPYASDVVKRLDRPYLGQIPSESWYQTALIATAIASLLLGLWFILANIRTRAFSNRDILAADPVHGETVINVQRVAEAACEALALADAITKAECKVAMVGQRPTATFTVTADPAYNLDDAIDAIEDANADFRLANDTMEIDSVWKLQLDRIAA